MASLLLLLSMAATNTGDQLLLCASQLGLGVFELLWGPSYGVGVVVCVLVSAFPKRRGAGWADSVHGAPAGGTCFSLEVWVSHKINSLQEAPGSGLFVRKWEQLMDLSDEK